MEQSSRVDPLENGQSILNLFMTKHTNKINEMFSVKSGWKNIRERL